MNYEFTTDWFSRHITLWSVFIEKLKPQKILEVGSFEGRATVFMIQQAGQYNPVDIHCVDTWRGSIEHGGINFDEVQKRFDKNVEIAKQSTKNPVNVIKMVGKSLHCLSTLAKFSNSFDLVYIDGSHIASDVFFDAAMAFQLTRVGGAIVFDDYREDKENIYMFPKVAIDAFATAHENKIQHMRFYNKDEEIPSDKLYQRYYWKIAE